MTKQRKAGDWVWLLPNSGFTGNSNEFKVEIQPQEYEISCFCDDRQCREWLNVCTEPDENGERINFYHVSEHEMLDEKFTEEKA
jgi:hypothetical protein